MARLAICSDLHSRIDKLQAVLEDIARCQLDEISCLGDLLGGGPGPVVVIDGVHTWPLVLGGNHDAWLAGGAMWPEELSMLNAKRLAWLRALRP